MGKKGVIALLSCVFALCLALVGCGSSDDGSAAAKAAFTGTWDLVEMSQGDEVTGADELETLKSLGLEVYVNLNEDGTSALVLFGEVIDGTWEASSTTAGTITMENQEVSMTIEDSKLAFEQEGAKLTFEKGEAKEVPSSDEADDEATDENAEADEEAATDESAAADEASTAEEEAADEATAEEAADEAQASEDEAAPAEDTAAESESSSSSAQ